MWRRSAIRFPSRAGAASLPREARDVIAAVWARLRPRLRELLLLGFMRAAMLGYLLVAVAAAEAGLRALRRLF